MWLAPPELHGQTDGSRACPSRPTYPCRHPQLGTVCDGISLNNNINFKPAHRQHRDHHHHRRGSAPPPTPPHPSTAPPPPPHSPAGNPPRLDNSARVSQSPSHCRKHGSHPRHAIYAEPGLYVRVGSPTSLANFVPWPGTWKNTLPPRSQTILTDGRTGPPPACLLPSDRLGLIGFCIHHHGHAAQLAEIIKEEGKSKQKQPRARTRPH